MHYIVLDLEFNQSFPFKTGKKTEPVAECPFEIIQIGAVKLNEQFDILEEFNYMIRPQIYPRLHPFVEKITGIREKVSLLSRKLMKHFCALSAKKTLSSAHGVLTTSSLCSGISSIIIWMPML